MHLSYDASISTADRDNFIYPLAGYAGEAVLHSLTKYGKIITPQEKKLTARVLGSAYNVIITTIGV